MSRVGSKPVEIASGVEVKLGDGRVHVTGPKGQLDEPMAAGIRIDVTDGLARVTRESEDKPVRSAHGLMRSLLANMVIGVTKGFERELEIIGVGYRVEVKGRELTVNAGYSHPVILKIPEGLEVVAKSPTNLLVQGISKQKVGQFASEIRAVRKPEPYKGKGIKYIDEHIRRKAGKAVVGG